MTSFLEALRAKQRESQRAAAATTEPAVPQESLPIEGTDSKPAESVAPAAAPKSLSFLASVARRSGTTPAPVPSVVVDDSPSILTDDSESDAPAEGNVVSSEGHGDAPVNAAELVEVSESGSATTAELFRARLDALDELCQAESGITPLTHDSVKSHVKVIMTDLRDNPEMRGLLLDQDMHNIMLFIQSSTQVQQAKVEKTEKKRATKTKSQIAADAFDFASLDAVPTLESMGSKNTDSIQTKVR